MSSLLVPKSTPFFRRVALVPATRVMRSLSSSASDATASSITGASSMLADAYRQHSHHQYSVHLGCLDMLQASIERTTANLQPLQGEKRFHLVDLGSADGSNSLQTLQHVLDYMPQDTIKMHVTFEEHPDSDEQALQAVLDQQSAWFDQHDVTHDVLLQSFYEPLFPHQSINQFLSYLCLHWLDTRDFADKSWKTLVNNDELKHAATDLTSFTMISDDTAPPALEQVWRDRLAKQHLANFFYLRALELQVGGEGVFCMVADPHDFNRPPNSSSGVGILTQAMQRCVANGTLRSRVLQDTIVPYYMRKEQDVLDSLDLANQELAKQHGNIQLELMDLRYYSTTSGGGEGDSGFNGIVQMFWSIHGGAARAAGLAPAEEVALLDAVHDVFAECFPDPSAGVNGHFLTAVIRRK